MTFDTLIQLYDRFRVYTDSFRADGVLEPMLQLKLEHTVRVAADARTIAEGMEWAEGEVNLGEAVGLFHDTARFPQFRKYRSFCDSETVDHGDLGAETLRAARLLDGVADGPRALILHAVRHHNKKHLPGGMSAAEERHLRLIRDADRLDIFFVCRESIASGRIHDHPEIAGGVDFDGPPTPAVLEQFERGVPIDYRAMQSMADRFILQLSWMHDMSYRASRRLIRDRRVLEHFIEMLPVRTDRLLRCFDSTAAVLAGA